MFAALPFSGPIVPMSCTQRILWSFTKPMNGPGGSSTTIGPASLEIDGGDGVRRIGVGTAELLPGSRGHHDADFVDLCARGHPLLHHGLGGDGGIEKLIGLDSAAQIGGVVGSLGGIGDREAALKRVWRELRRDSPSLERTWSTRLAVLSS